MYTSALPQHMIAKACAMHQHYTPHMAHTWLQPDTFTGNTPNYRVPDVFATYAPLLSRACKNHRKQSVGQNTTMLTLPLRKITSANSNLAKPNWIHSLPFQQFHALLTLFPKSFSPFPHGTCLLSVSDHYLALDEIYHHICAPIPRNVTLRTYAVYNGLQMTSGTITLIGALFQKAYICATIGNTPQDNNSKQNCPNLHAELIPVHSPLLGESYLVSHPPLTYMLKFSGFAGLTSGLYCVLVPGNTDSIY